MLPYVAIQHSGGIVVLSSHGEHGAYGLFDPSLPAPEVREQVRQALFFGARVTGPRDEFATRSLPVVCMAASGPEAEDLLNALSRSVREHRARILWRSWPGMPTIWTTIRSATVREESSRMVLRNQGLLYAQVSLTTDAEWTGDAVSGTEVVRGDRPARMRLKITSPSANALLGVGIKNDPGDEYDPHFVEGSPAAQGLTSTFEPLHVADAIDTNTFRGSHIAVAKLATNATQADFTRYRTVAKTSGSGVAASALAPHDSVAALATAARWQAMPGIIDIPAGGVPGIEVGSGLGEPVVVSPFADGTDEVAIGEAVFRREDLPRGEHVGFDTRLKNTSAEPRVVRFELHRDLPSGFQTGWGEFAGHLAATEVELAGSFDGTVEARWDSPVSVSPGTHHMVVSPGGFGTKDDVVVVGARGTGGGGMYAGTYWHDGIWKSSPETLLSQGSGTAYSHIGRVDGVAYRERQTLTFARSVKITGGIIHARSESGTPVLTVNGFNGEPLGPAVTTSTTATDITFGTGSTQYVIPAGQEGGVSVAAITLDVATITSGIRVYRAETNPYAGGIRQRVVGGTVTDHPTHDLRMSLTGYDSEPFIFRSAHVMRLPLGFDTEVTIEGMCSEESKTATYHGMTLLPADDFAAVFEYAFPAGWGVIIEAVDPLSPAATYLTTATEGTAGTAIMALSWQGAPRLPLGTNEIVTVGDGSIAVTCEHYPCYSNAAAGSL